MQDEILDDNLYQKGGLSEEVYMRNNIERANYAMYAFYGMLVAVSFLTLFYLFLLLTGDSILNADISLGIIGLIGVGYIVIYIVAIVMFSQWFRRAYKNIQIIGYKTNHTDGWAVGGFFVPFLNLFRPYDIMREVWQQMRLTAEGNGFKHYLQGGIYGWWWALFLLHGFLGRISTQINKNAYYLDEGVLMFDIFALVTEIIALLLAITVIKRLRDTEEELRKVGY